MIPNTAQSLVVSDIVIYNIPTKDLVPSSFAPQVRRREHFNDADLKEFASTIKTPADLLSPIIARRLPAGAIEIVAGERRWRAFQINNFPSIPCFIREVSDIDAFKLQSDENLQREEPDAIDFAMRCKFYIDEFGWTEAELCEEYHKDAKTIAEFVQLNNLIPQAIDDYENHFLRAGHLKLIAPYSHDEQAKILANLTYHDNDRDEGAYTVKQLKNHIRDKFTLKLSAAPFDKENPALHIRGLQCSKCHEQTDNRRALFEGDFDGESRCLNPQCYESKTHLYRKLQLTQIARRLPNPENKPLDELAASVPIVTDQRFVLDPKLKTKILTGRVLDDEPACSFSAPALRAEGGRQNSIGYLCGNPECPTHHPPAAPPKMTDGYLAALKTDFNREVGTAVRLEVIKTALDHFDGNHIFWQYEDLVKKLIVENLVKNPGFSETVKILIGKWKNKPKSLDKYEKIAEFVDSLNPEQQSKILFILANLDETKAQYSESETRRESFAALAKNYTKINLKILDAEIRVKLAPPEYKEECEQYHAALQNDVEMPKPKMWISLQEDKL